jgi:hypothetical protein
MDPMVEYEGGEDYVGLDSGVSVVSSEWRNVSSSGSSSPVEDELTAKECVPFTFIAFLIQSVSSQHRELARILGNLGHPSPCRYGRDQRYLGLPFLPRRL